MSKDDVVVILVRIPKSFCKVAYSSEIAVIISFNVFNVVMLDIWAWC